MTLDKRLKSYLIIIAYIIVGLVIMGVVQLLKVPVWLNPSVIILLLFVFINIITERVFRLDNGIKKNWSFKKIAYLPIGIVIGGVIAISPVLAGLLAGEISTSEISVKTVFTVASFALTLVIVAWEELWFRGIFLNYCNKHLSSISISITMGFLFMVVHILNPEINLLKTGPSLFFAGAFLTMVYFYFRVTHLHLKHLVFFKLMCSL